MTTKKQKKRTTTVKPPKVDTLLLAVTDMIEQKLSAFRDSIVAEVVEKLKPAQAEAERDPFSLEQPMPSVEREAYAPVLDSFRIRQEVGMSHDLAEVLSKLERGIDLTPVNFKLPPGESYFTQVPGFQAHFITLVKEGATCRDAYVETCTNFSLETLERPNVYRKILAELPDIPTGAFALGRGEAAEKLGIPLLGSGEK